MAFDTAIHEPRDDTRLDRLVSFSVLAVAILALGIFAVLLGSDGNGDLRSYHHSPKPTTTRRWTPSITACWLNPQ